jgi:hypothetical protein
MPDTFDSWLREQTRERVLAVTENEELTDVFWAIIQRQINLSNPNATPARKPKPRAKKRRPR